MEDFGRVCEKKRKVCVVKSKVGKFSRDGRAGRMIVIINSELVEVRVLSIWDRMR